MLPAQRPCFHINEANVIPASLGFSCSNGVLYMECQNKAFGPYPETGFKLSCLEVWSLSHEGIETPQWGAGVVRAGSLPGPSPLHRGLENCRKTWLQHAPSPYPTLPWSPGWFPRVIFHSSLPGPPDPSSAPAGSGWMRHWRWASLCSLLSELIISVASSRTHFISAIPWAMLSRKAKSLLYKMKS